jgi:N-succinyldiaminopimelate aminotransferase
MNSRLDTLHPYPFEKLRALLAQATVPTGLAPINLSIGEPKHETPALIIDAMKAAMAGLAVYPPTKGDAALRQTISQWIGRRYDITPPDPETQVLPACGSREALFSFAQTVVNAADDALVICPNPFYQIYEGAALLAGATPWYINSQADRNFGYDWAAVAESVWARTQLVYVCSPGNPAGNVTTLDEWRTLFELSDRHGFVIAADECYSEIYFNEDDRPLGALQAAQMLGRDHYRNLVSFSSLSKRSNVPGLRSGFIAGDANILKQYLLYRTYHGSALSAVVSKASMTAWNDEQHVIDNRRQYREKFDAVLPILAPVLDVQRPQAGFYLWALTPGSDTQFTLDLYRQAAITVLPGSYLAREAHGTNPGAGRVRMALVASKEQCVEAAHRIVDVLRGRSPGA